MVEYKFRSVCFCRPEGGISFITKGSGPFGMCPCDLARGGKSRFFTHLEGRSFPICTPHFEQHFKLLVGFSFSCRQFRSCSVVLTFFAHIECGTSRTKMTASRTENQTKSSTFCSKSGGILETLDLWQVGLGSHVMSHARWPHVSSCSSRTPKPTPCRSWPTSRHSEQETPCTARCNHWQLARVRCCATLPLEPS